MVGHRSTRNKMRFQMEKVADHLDRTFKHFQYLEELTGGGSPHVNETLPLIVAATQELKLAVLRFRETL